MFGSYCEWFIMLTWNTWSGFEAVNPAPRLIGNSTAAVGTLNPTMRWLIKDAVDSCFFGREEVFWTVVAVQRPSRRLHRMRLFPPT